VAIRRRKLYEDIADHLDKLIQAGAYAPTELLPSERDLMKHFGVGRPAIREALFHLRKMVVVELRSGERARVTRPTPQLVIDALSGTARHVLSAPNGAEQFQAARVPSSRLVSSATPPTSRQEKILPTSRLRWRIIASRLAISIAFRRPTSRSTMCSW
jgi:DNA-binding FadR family transcriptional regulator